MEELLRQLRELTGNVRVPAEFKSENMPALDPSSPKTVDIKVWDTANNFFTQRLQLSLEYKEFAHPILMPGYLKGKTYLLENNHLLTFWVDTKGWAWQLIARHDRANGLSFEIAIAELKKTWITSYLTLTSPKTA